MRDLTLTVLFVLIVLIGLFALAYPWTFTRRSDRIVMHQPLLMLLLFGLYELAVPPSSNIRIDWLILFPLLSLVFVAYAVKLWLSNR